MSAYIIKGKWVAFSFYCKNKVCQTSLVLPMPVLCCGPGKGSWCHVTQLPQGFLHTQTLLEANEEMQPC